MRKTLSVRPEQDRAAAPELQRKGRGWAIAESRLDTLHEAAREMRRNPSAAQTALAESFVRAELGKYRFRQHVVIGSAIVDFACQPLGIAVAIDDEQAGDPALDRRRDKSLEVVGVKVLRFPAAEVLADADAVAATVVAQMKLRWQEQRARPNSHSRDRRPQGARRDYQR
ncbi:MAG TPA: DUF559 domain-containing protein [Novosphingobium sp.]|nr:DUF559 domain-containing protein [Novosphingobium sp.]